MNGEHSVQIARLDERTEAILARLTVIEAKLDRQYNETSDLRVKVAIVAAAVAVVVGGGAGTIASIIGG